MILLCTHLPFYPRPFIRAVCRALPPTVTSAKTPENVEEAFQQLTERFLEAFPDANNGRANGHRKKPCTIC